MQQSLFPDLENPSLTISHICENGSEYIEIYEKHGVNYKVLDVKDVTFKGGTKEPVHSWFRLTPSYSPELVRFFLSYLECNQEHEIFDPFNGKGTTIIECKKRGFKSTAIELNPLLYNVTKWSLNWDISADEIEKYASLIKEAFHKEKEASVKLNLEPYLAKYNFEIPKIHNPFRWWKEYVIRDLLLLKYLVYKLVPQNRLDVFNVILSVIGLDCANIHRNHPTISFDDNHNREIKVWQEFEDNVEKCLNDLKVVKKLENLGTALVYEGDSTDIYSLIQNMKFDRLITSPPYPNRFSYIHTTRPQLFFMELIDNAKEATEIDLKAIGGTWGRATSILQKEYLEPHPEIEEFLEYIPLLKPKSLLMCNYATKYFNMMHDHIRSLRKVANQGFKGVYVVGNSRLSGIEIYTEIILGKIFEKEGFNFDEVVVFRKRGGKKKLYETGVCISL